MDLAELTAEMLRLSKLLDDALSYLRRQAVEYAEAEDAYRLARSKAILAASGTVDEKKAQADLETSEQRQRALLADGMRQAALEAVRSRRGQLSALQSVTAAYRAEAELARTAPDYAT